MLIYCAEYFDLRCKCFDVDTLVELFVVFDTVFFLILFKEQVSCIFDLVK